MSGCLAAMGQNLICQANLTLANCNLPCDDIMFDMIAVAMIVLIMRELNWVPLSLT